MKQQEAKDLTIRTWELIVKYELTSKLEIWDYDKELFNSIKDELNKCPLCTLFNNYFSGPRILWDNACSGCPLKESGNQCDQEDESDPYSSWGAHYTDMTEKMEGARRVLEIVRAWEPEGGNDEAEAHR